MGTSLLTLGRTPTLMPGERVRHVKRWLGLVVFHSLPSHRWLFTLPPLCDAVLRVTDRRLILSDHVMLAITQHASFWRPGTPTLADDVIDQITVDRSRVLGPYVQIISEAPNTSWWRSRTAWVRIYSAESARLLRKITDADLLPQSGQRR
ncbi:MAG: hypothetical protein AAF266_00850 [Planctomycetota bacterium]